MKATQGLKRFSTTATKWKFDSKISTFYAHYTKATPCIHLRTPVRFDLSINNPIEVKLLLSTTRKHHCTGLINRCACAPLGK